MVNVRSNYKSFNGGVVTPEFYGQISDPKFQTGLAQCLNALILPHGPVRNRAGTKFTRETKTSSKKARTLPFNYSTTQTLALELGDTYLRMHTQGATLLYGAATAWSNATNYVVGDLASRLGVTYYCTAAHINQQPPNAAYWYALPASGEFEVPTPYLEADLFDIHYVQSRDVLTMVHPGYAPRELRRLGATYWTLTTISFSSELAAPTGAAAAANVASVRNISNITQANPAVVTTSTAHGWLTGQSVYVAGVVGMTEVNDRVFTITKVAATTFKLDGENSTGYTAYSSGGTASKSGGTFAVGYYKVTAVGTDGNEESLPSAEVSANNDLFTTGNYNTVTWSAVAGALRYNVYKKSNGLYGYIGQTEELTFKDDNIAADLALTIPIANTPFGADGSSDCPGAVSYFDQRRIFAGTVNKPQNVWMTRPGTESNLSYSIPSRAVDGITFRIASRENNTIRHIMPLAELLLLTSSMETKISSKNSDSLTQATVGNFPQSYIGASNVQPVTVNNNLIYEAARGGHVMEAAYSWQASGYTSGDLSLRAPHLFDGYTIKDMAYAKAPYPIIWAVSSNGKLLGLTYVPTQQVGAWHEHNTDGTFESCTTVAEGAEDALYVVVKRTIGGTTKRFIERMASRFFTSLHDAYFVDCGATLDSPLTVTAITKANPGVVTSAAHGLNNGDQVDLSDIVGMVELEGVRAFVANKTANTFELTNELGANINTTAYTTFTSGYARKAILTINSGLSHLEGKTVSILANGAVQPQQIVTGGAITLEQPASRVHIGLPYTTDVQTLPLAFEAAEAGGQGRQKSLNQAHLRLYQSGGVKVGPNFENMETAKLRTTEPYGTPPSLKTKTIPIRLSPAWDAEGQTCLRQDQPLPFTLVSMSVEVAIGS